MNTASRWRIEFAKKVAPVYAAHPNVVAVVLGGSSSRGHADNFSDIELGVFWDRDPSDDERRQFVEDCGGELIAIYPFHEPDQVWCDDFFLGRTNPDDARSGILFEIVHYRKDYIDTIIDDVVLRHEPNLQKQNNISGVSQGIALAGEGVVADWVKRVEDYPDELVEAMLKRYAQMDHFSWRWPMWIQRGNPMMLHQHFVDIGQQLLLILMALNRRYYFGYKWLNVIDEQLTVKPDDFLKRFNSVYELPPDQASIQLIELVEEVYDLIEQHAPSINVDWLRNVFRYKRPDWSNPPIFENW